MNSQHKKGQSAMEYIQTYGWALLIMIILLAFILLILSNLNAPQYCFFDEKGVSCSDPTLPAITKDGYLLAQITNGLNKGIYLKGLLCVDEPPDPLSYLDNRTKYIVPKEYLAPNQAFLVNKYNLTCYSGNTVVNLSEKSFHGHLYVWYNYVTDPPGYPERYMHAMFNIDVLQELFSNLTGGNGTTPGGNGTYVCGDGACDSGESCAVDCGTVLCNNNGICDDGEGLACSDCSNESCGNGPCDSNENSLICPSDCGGSGPGTECGNNICEDGETVENCSSDCSTDSCGNGVCELNENTDVCPADCSDDTCGNGICEIDETVGTCPDDCDGGSVCGDDVCGENEQCSEDCSVETHCDDGVDNDEDNLVDCDDPDCANVGVCPPICNNNGECEPDLGEMRSNCPDCYGCDLDGICNGPETFDTCPQDCHCGNHICEDGQEGREDYGENPITCSKDCESDETIRCYDNDFCDIWYCDSGLGRGKIFTEPSSCPDCLPSCNFDGICQEKIPVREHFGCFCSYSYAWSKTCESSSDSYDGPNENETNCRDCSCGNGVCESDSPLNEDKSTCPEDCCGTDHCGDGECNCGESKDTCPEDCVICGDGVCDLEYGENLSNCEQDCAECGDGPCDYTKGENNNNCPEDCYCGDGVCLEGYGNCNDDCPYCGDGICNVEFNEPTNCPDDCPNSCGNGRCEVGESPINCPYDCHCGNHECEPDLGESIKTCEIDCNFCGDGICETQYGENYNTCQQDCPSSWCGNGACDHGETSRTCPPDCCSPVCGDGECEYWCGETVYNCESDCGSCGNGVCDNGETNETCSIDCSEIDDDTIDANSIYCGEEPPEDETALRTSILTLGLSKEDDPTDTQLLIVNPTLEAKRFNTGILSLTQDPKRSNIKVVDQNTLQATWEDWTDFDCDDIRYHITVKNGKIELDFRSSECAGHDGLILNLRFEKPTRVKSLSRWFRYDETKREHSIVLPRNENDPLCSPLSPTCTLCGYCCGNYQPSCRYCPSKPFDVKFDIVGWDGSWMFNQD